MSVPLPPFREALIGTVVLLAIIVVLAAAGIYLAAC